jgi:hypothetical protein
MSEDLEDDEGCVSSCSAGSVSTGLEIPGEQPLRTGMELIRDPDVVISAPHADCDPLKKVAPDHSDALAPLLPEAFEGD